MANFLVTINFTADGVPKVLVMGVDISVVANATAAITLATNFAISTASFKLPGQTIVIGTTSAVPR